MAQRNCEHRTGCTLTLRLVLVFTVAISHIEASIECFHHWPSNGTWMEDPPFWKVNGCEVKMFDEGETTDCLGGKTIYVMGNSVARQTAYGIYEMLGGDEISRSEQKAECPKDGISWGSSCSKNIKNVNIFNIDNSAKF